MKKAAFYTDMTLWFLLIFISLSYLGEKNVFKMF